MFLITFASRCGLNCHKMNVTTLSETKTCWFELTIVNELPLMTQHCANQLSE